ncbi:MAG: hypothetical protein DRO99_02445 [Candidatus Aenigmatarchaeota archaeon]|nr:MAG: hypothetical protein DRO99_02445 [Candidatus Aenigmarchaeota archaeon]
MPPEVATMDEYVRRAIDFFEQAGDYELNLPESDHTLVVGSQNGYLAGRVIYRFAGRVFSHAAEVLAKYEIDTKKDILGDVTIVSASGSRNIVPIAGYALDAGLPVNVIVCKEDSEVKREFGDRINEILVPATDEPPTINTSTYGRMVQGITHEDMKTIRKAIRDAPEPEGGYGRFGAFSLILPDNMPEVAEMARWKINGEILGRQAGTIAAYKTNMMHGAGVIDSEKELYVGIGAKCDEFGTTRGATHHIGVPDGFGPLGYMLLSYHIIGMIQKQYPAFQERIWEYKKMTSGWEWVSPI